MKYIQTPVATPIPPTEDANEDFNEDANSDSDSSYDEDDNNDEDDNEDEDECESEDNEDQAKEEEKHIEIKKEKNAREKVAREKVAREKVARPKLDKLQYREFRKNIFKLKRICFVISQDEIIRDDIKTMNIADKAYDKNPRDFKCSNFDLPPDVLRCSFIRKHHHRYYRCRNQISNNDSDVCKKHEESENIYYDQYNELCEKLI